MDLRLASMNLRLISERGVVCSARRAEVQSIWAGRTAIRGCSGILSFLGWAPMVPDRASEAHASARPRIKRRLDIGDTAVRSLSECNRAHRIDIRLPA